MFSWTDLRELVKDEITQRSEEGCNTSGFSERLDGCRNNDDLMALYEDLRQLRTQDSFPYVEPSHLAGIRAARPTASKRTRVKADDQLLDRVHGAWLGRCAGCMLGKPVEGWSEEHIRKYLEFVGEYPLTDYVPPAPESLPEGMNGPRRGMGRGEFPYGMADDDTNYTVLGLNIMEEHGPDFSTKDVGNSWLWYLPFLRVCTAERRAYANLVNSLPIERVPVHLNPYREWIGAQIRADFWGYCTPGWPEKAAEFAYHDAGLSHVKNGIYGEMFCAAAISAALVTDDVREIIAIAANEIPAQSRLAETVADCLRWRDECSTWQEAFSKLLDTYYGKYSPVHTNNNLGIVLIALLYGWPDFDKVLTISVMQGMDTDCNGATVGSIIGAALGSKSLPRKLIDPLNGKLETEVLGFPLVEIEELAQRTMKQIEVVSATS